MKKLILVLAAVAGASAFGYSKEAVDDARDLLRVAKERFSVGELTRTDVASAEVYLFEMEYLAGYISKADYCPKAIASAETFLAGTYEEFRVGQRTFDNVRDAKKALYKLKYECR